MESAGMKLKLHHYFVEQMASAAGGVIVEQVSLCKFLNEAIGSDDMPARGA
jgi:hypothetical protein